VSEKPIAVQPRDLNVPAVIHPLEFDFDAAREQEIAERRRGDGMARVEASTLRRDPDFESRALDAVRRYAEEHAQFLAEDVRKVCATPENVNPKTWGPLFTRARKHGWIRADGTALANSSNRSPKTRWASLIHRPQ
jgi:hypothetical protein